MLRFDHEKYLNINVGIPDVVGVQKKKILSFPNGLRFWKRSNRKEKIPFFSYRLKVKQFDRTYTLRCINFVV